MKHNISPKKPNNDMQVPGAPKKIKKVRILRKQKLLESSLELQTKLASMPLNDNILFNNNL